MVIGRHAACNAAPLVDHGGGAIFYPRPTASPRPCCQAPALPIPLRRRDSHLATFATDRLPGYIGFRRFPSRRCREWGSRNFSFFLPFVLLFLCFFLLFFFFFLFLLLRNHCARARWYYDFYASRILPLAIQFSITFTSLSPVDIYQDNVKSLGVRYF